MIKFFEKYPILSIILFVGIMLLPHLDAMDVTIMEARNFVTAREMLTDNHWILTTNNGEPRYQKPPLPTWLSAISASIFGVKSVWAMRLPAVLMVMLLGSMIFTLSRKLKLTRSHSLINGFISITSLYIVLIIFEGPWDIYAHAFMLAGIFFLYKRLQSKHALNIGEWVLATLFVAASILSKGPVSLYALFLPFLTAYIIIYRKYTVRQKWIVLTLSLTLSIILGFVWYAYVRYIDPTSFAAIATRETGNWTSRNVRPFYYYWSFFVQSGLWAIPAFMSLLYPYMKSRVICLKAYQFTLIWTIAAVILLSIIPEKKSRYLMPVLIPLAINSGFYIEYLIRRFKNIQEKRETLPVYFNFGLIITVFTIFPVAIAYIVIVKDLSFGIIEILFLILVLVFSTLMARSLLKKNVYTLFYLTMGAILCTVLCGFSLLKEYNPNPRYVSFEELDLEPSIAFYSYERMAPTLIWDAGRKVPILSEDNFYPVEDNFYLLICSNCKNPEKEQFSNYLRTQVGYIDLNRATPGSKPYKMRKAGNVYLYQKKAK